MKFICLGCFDKEAWSRLSVGDQAALIVECKNFDVAQHPILKKQQEMTT